MKLNTVSNGKGSNTRKTDLSTYEKNHLAIDWSKKADNGEGIVVDPEGVVG